MPSRLLTTRLEIQTALTPSLFHAEIVQLSGCDLGWASTARSGLERNRLLWGLDLEREYETTTPFWYTGQCPLIDRGVAVIALMAANRYLTILTGTCGSARPRRSTTARNVATTNSAGGTNIAAEK